MPWDAARGRGRYEVIFRNKELHDFVEQNARKLNLSVDKYLQLLARAVQLLGNGDQSLASLLGCYSPPAGMVSFADVPVPNKDKIDRALEQMGL